MKKKPPSPPKQQQEVLFPVRDPIFPIYITTKIQKQIHVPPQQSQSIDYAFYQKDPQMIDALETTKMISKKIARIILTGQSLNLDTDTENINSLNKDDSLELLFLLKFGVINEFTLDDLFKTEMSLQKVFLIRRWIDLGLPIFENNFKKINEYLNALPKSKVLQKRGIEALHIRIHLRLVRDKILLQHDISSSPFQSNNDTMLWTIMKYQ